MTDEEKQAMKDCDIIFINLEDMMSEEGANDYRKSYKILKNLIEKQTKLIDKLYKSLEDEIGTIVNLGILVDENAREKRDVSKYIDEVQLFLNTLNYNYISKDKIKAKIEELENYYKELYKQDNSPNEFLIGQDCLSKLSILQEVKQSLLEKEE